MFRRIPSVDAETPVSVPLRGVGCFRALLHPVPYRRGVSVPLRGVGCFEWLMGFPAGWRFPSPCGVWVVSTCRCATGRRSGVSVPLRGVGCFRSRGVFARLGAVSVPLRGVGCFQIVPCSERAVKAFPSPCGVWVVSSANMPRL